MRYLHCSAFASGAAIGRRWSFRLLVAAARVDLRSPLAIESNCSSNGLIPAPQDKEAQVKFTQWLQGLNFFRLVRFLKLFVWLIGCLTNKPV